MKRPKRRRKTSLHAYLIRVQLFALASVVITLAAYFVYSFRFIERQMLQANDTMLSVVSEGIVRAAGETTALAFNIAYNPEVQRSLTEKNVLALIKYSNTFYTIAKMTVKSSELIDDVALFNRDLSIFRNVSNDITYSDYKSALLDHLAAAPYRQGRFIAVDLDNNERYLCFVLPVHSRAADSKADSLIGYSLTSFRIDRIAEPFRRISSLENSYTAIIDRTGAVISFASTRPDSTLGLEELFRHPARFVKNEQDLPGLKGTLISFIPKLDIYRRQVGFLVLSPSLVGILLAVFFLMGNRLNHAFSVPIERLVAQLESFDGSDRRLRVEGIPKNEIGYITDSINSMLDKIHDMTARSIFERQRMSDLELHSKDAELLALQSQINPHFMYNTLECLRSIGIDYGSSEIVQISTGLADILRYCLSTDFQVPLHRELAIVREYSQIIRLRFGDRYSFDIEADAEARNAVVIKMIIQPIVENAVFHGLEKRRTGLLSVRCSRVRDTIVAVVYDNGQGMDQAHLESLREQLLRGHTTPDHGRSDRRGLGLVNIHRRIQTFYGEKYGIAIDSEPESGTSVTIVLPVLDRETSVGG